MTVFDGSHMTLLFYEARRFNVHARGKARIIGHFGGIRMAFMFDKRDSVQ
jgi:hypothetical protein